MCTAAFTGLSCREHTTLNLVEHVRDQYTLVNSVSNAQELCGQGAAANMYLGLTDPVYDMDRRALGAKGI